MRSLWRRRWFRWASWAAFGFVAFVFLFWLLIVRNLPDAAALAKYEPPLPTMVRDAYGEPVHSYARERRVELSYGDLPKNLIGAYLSAEDKTFFEHGGLDYPGIASAIFDNVFSSRDRSRGASTITQQVAKNILLTNEYSYSRKIKEAILAYRIEGALDKEQILTLYLNEIPWAAVPMVCRRQVRPISERRRAIGNSRNGVPCHFAKGAGNLWPVEKRSNRRATPQLGVGGDGGQWLYHRRRNDAGAGRNRWA